MIASVSVEQAKLVIEPVGGGDEFAHLVIGEDDVARLLRIRQTGKSDFPSIPVLYALVVLRRQFQRGAQATAKPVDGRGAIVPSRPSRHFFSSVAASNATGFDNSTLVRCRRGQSAL